MDTAMMSSEAAQELRNLIQRSGLSQSVQLISKEGRDLRQYEVSIEEGPDKVSVVLDDATIPSAARALIGYLKKYARPMPLDSDSE